MSFTAGHSREVPFTGRIAPSDFGSVESAAGLALSGHPMLRHVYCEFNDGVMTLSGTVASWYLKQMAQSMAGNIDGVRRIENRIEVRSRR